MTAGAPLAIPQHHQAAVANGAECWRCPLLGGSAGGPVPPTIPPGHLQLMVVAEAPGVNEVQAGQTLIGASGREVRRALGDAKVDMNRVGLTNALLCRPPGDLKKYLRDCRKKGLANPIECCRPRLMNDIRNTRTLLLMGGASVQAVVAHGNTSVMKVRGTPIQTASGHLAVATPHAAFVLRDDGARYRPVFHADIAKAARLSYGGNTWQDPWYFVPKTAAEVANFLAVQRPRVAVDVETDGVDQWTCGLRRIGIGTDKEVMIYSPLSVHGHMLLGQDEIGAQSRVIADYFRRQGRIDGHNIIGFDSVVLHRFGMPIVDDNTFDTMVGHSIGYTSELPHRLDFLGSMYTDAPYWKEDVKHSSVKSDEVLNKYLSYDIAVTYASSSYVEQNLVSSQQTHIYQLDAELYRIGRSMSALGIYIDPAKRLAFATEYQEQSDRLRGEFVQIARDVGFVPVKGETEINPGSYPQIRKLLYDHLGLPVLDDHITGSDEPSTDENTLLDLLALGLDERASKVIHALIGYREAEKILGTNTGHVVDGRLEGGPLIHADGRLRAGWRPGKVTGRWGSNDPNMQNIPKKLRAMFVPYPGNTFVAADMQAVELRAIAILSGDQPLVNAFVAFDNKTGPDVHIANACGLFHCKPEQVDDKVRNFVKRFVYALSYGAEPPKIYQTLSLLRTDDLQPMFPHISLRQIEQVFKTYWELHPAIPAWKKAGIYHWRANRFLATKFHGRKRYFIGGESPTEFANFPIQGVCADMQNDAIRALVRAYPFDFQRRRGLVLNVHDQLVVECGLEEVEDVKKIVKQCMERRIGEMLFPAEPKAASDWKAVS